MENEITINEKTYKVERFLGKGKGGYSYLVTDGAGLFTAKLIHHEPCEYYSFGDKLAAELADYARIKAVGIRLPELIEVDRARERILKQFIDGETVMELVVRGALSLRHLAEVRGMSEKCRAAGLNLDWFPTNFIDCGGELYYIDYECNEYSDEWSFENWGVKYWSKTPELKKYLDEHK